MSHDGPRPLSLPLLIACDGDVKAYSSIVEAEVHIEPVDVVDGLYVGYDREGRLLEILVEGTVKQRGWTVDQHKARVRIKPAEDLPQHAPELNSLLRDYLSACGWDAEALARLDLASLAHHAEGESRKR